jgi:hypothetical protein
MTILLKSLAVKKMEIMSCNIVVKHSMLKKLGLHGYDVGLLVRCSIVAEECNALVCEVKSSKINIV